MDDHTPATDAGFVPLRLMVQGSEVGVDLTLPDLVVGRHTDTDVRLPLADVSRRHCRFVFQHGFWKIIDLNSMNGVFVNGERMQEATLYEGYQIRLGGFTFSVRVLTQARIVPMPEPRTTSGENDVLQQIAEVLPRTTEGEQRKAS